MTRRCLMPAALAACLAIGILRVDAGSQSRDQGARPRLVSVGTSAISGRVMTDDTPARPLRRVTVTAAETAGAIVNRLALTDDEGRFTIGDLPPGRYMVTATRPPFLTGAYGARRVAGPGSIQTGTAIVLQPDQHVADVTIRLMRGAVISGTIRDADGQPARGFYVGLAYYRRSPTTGERTLVRWGTTGYTDDRGMYRLYGLPPGEYVVTASIGARQTDLMTATETEIQRAFALLQPGAAAPAASTLAGASSAGPVPRRPTVGYVSIYYPGTPTPDHASSITVGVGEERTGVDFQAQLVPTLRIDGMLTTADGQPVPRASVRANSVVASVAADYYGSVGGGATTDTDGRFRISGLPPGTYVVSTRVTSPASLWAAVETVLHSSDAIVHLTLATGTRITGRVTVHGVDAAPPTDLSRVRVMLSTADRGGAAAGTSIIVQPNGTFEADGVPPGRYTLHATLGVATAQGGWYVKSAALGGQDATDKPVEIAPGTGELTAAVTLTDHTTELSGTMTDATNAPAPEYFIIVFSRHATDWQPGTRRIMQTRPAQDGRFSFRNLPPGEYQLAAVTDVQDGEWLDPQYLAQLLPVSIPVTLGTDERKIQDIRLR
jgi:hypothetical protein